MKKEPDFMQRCWDCRKIIWTFDRRDPNKCKGCFKHPKPVVNVAITTYNFEVKQPKPYNWMDNNAS